MHQKPIKHSFLAVGSPTPPQNTLFLLLVRGDEGVVRTLFLLEALEENSSLFIFQLLEASSMFWFMAPSSKPAIADLGLNHLLLSSLLPGLSHFIKTLVIPFGAPEQSRLRSPLQVS